MAVAAENMCQQVVASFKRFDIRGDGIIARSFLAEVIRLISPDSFGKAAINSLLDAADKSCSGQIRYEEFLAWVLKDAGDQSTAPDPGISLDYRRLLAERFDIDISKRYARKGVLGEGGYGKVFVAGDKQFENRRVAVKVLGTVRNPRRIAAIRKEIEITKNLDHPNICKIFEMYERAASMFLVLEYCDGGELFERILEHKHISEAVTAQIIAQVASALLYAHGHSVAHRDIKPENVVFCSRDPADLSIKVIDWGLSINFDEEVMSTVVGSSIYQAPEVMGAADVHEYTRACDLWSLGVLTYVMLCGKPPFWGAVAKHLKAARSETYPMSGALWDTISGRAKEFIGRLLKANPEKRMDLETVVSHPWLMVKTESPDTRMTKQVLTNLTHFCNMSVFAAVCVACVARQLDHRRLRSIHQVFRRMDENGDGTLSLHEVSAGFEHMFGKDSPEFLQVLDTFKSLDLDVSTTIDYTEFCAASIGQNTSAQNEALWAAFKTFDLDNSNRVSKSEVQQILSNVDVRKAWTEAVCEEVAGKVVDLHDGDGDGMLDFMEWIAVMRHCWEAQVMPELAAGQDGSQAKRPEPRQSLVAP